jgi:hypothetical protein
MAPSDGGSMNCCATRVIWPVKFPINVTVPAEVDEAIRMCGGDVRAALRATLVANAYLDAEVERLTEAVSTGFARGRMRKRPQRVKI